MLTLFPQLLFLSPLGIFLIRIALAGIFFYSARVRFSQDSRLKLFGAIDGILALLLLVGISTQLAALVAAVCTFAWLVRPGISPYPRSTTILALVISIALIVMGAGPFAYDLPL